MSGPSLLALAAAFGTGVALPIFVFHYQRFWENCQRGSDVARKLVRSLEELHDAVGGLGFAAAFCGRPELYRKLMQTAPKTKEVRFLEEAMFDLHDDRLEKEISKTIHGLRSYVAYGLTDLMHQLADRKDWHVEGSQTHQTWTSYIDQTRAIHMPAIDRCLGALKPLTSPWGFWVRPSKRLWARIGDAARTQLMARKEAPALVPVRRRRRRRGLATKSLPQAQA